MTPDKKVSPSEPHAVPVSEVPFSLNRHFGWTYTLADPDNDFILQSPWKFG